MDRIRYSRQTASATAPFSHRKFLRLFKSRKEPNAPVETGVAAARAGHIGNLAYSHGGQPAGLQRLRVESSGSSGPGAYLKFIGSHNRHRPGS